MADETPATAPAADTAASRTADDSTDAVAPALRTALPARDRADDAALAHYLGIERHDGAVSSIAPLALPSPPASTSSPHAAVAWPPAGEHHHPDGLAAASTHDQRYTHAQAIADFIGRRDVDAVLVDIQPSILAHIQGVVFPGPSP